MLVGERCWIAEREGENVGSVLLMRETQDIARLRLLLVEPKARGLGIGARLVEEAVRFARAARYRKVPRSVINVRLLIRSPRPREQARWPARRGRAPWRSLAVPAIDIAKRGITNPYRILQHRRKHRQRIAG